MIISRNEIAARVEKFIRAQFRVSTDDPRFTRDVDLFDSGYVDSAGVVELISFLESTFQAKIQDDYLFSEDFATINGIGKIVSACLDPAAGSNQGADEEPTAKSQR
jgi:acyl carrier protein